MIFKLTLVIFSYKIYITLIRELTYEFFALYLFSILYFFMKIHFTFNYEAHSGINGYTDEKFIRFKKIS